MGRISQAFGAFFGILTEGKLPEELAASMGYVPREEEKPAPPPAPVVRPTDGALQMLMVLQRDARLLDFLMEDISGADDEQVGAAVRELHRQARTALERYVTLAPVIDGVEGTLTRLSSAMASDPQQVKLVGRVPADGKAPQGILRHRGWKATRVELPVPLADANTSLVSPAEVEIE